MSKQIKAIDTTEAAKLLLTKSECCGIFLQDCPTDKNDFIICASCQKKLFKLMPFKQL